MSPVVRVVLIAAAVVLGFDAAAAVASRVLGFPYAWATIGSVVIAAGTGYYGAQAGRRLSLGALAAGIVGLIDATLGWALSRAIGPVVPPENIPTTAPGVAGVAITVALVAAAIGWVGALIARSRGLLPAPPGA